MAQNTLPSRGVSTWSPSSGNHYKMFFFVFLKKPRGRWVSPSSPCLPFPKTGWDGVMRLVCIEDCAPSALCLVLAGGNLCSVLPFLWVACRSRARDGLSASFFLELNIFSCLPCPRSTSALVLQTGNLLLGTTFLISEIKNTSSGELSEPCLQGGVCSMSAGAAGGPSPVGSGGGSGGQSRRARWAGGLRAGSPRASSPFLQDLSAGSAQKCQQFLAASLTSLRDVVPQPTGDGAGGQWGHRHNGCQPPAPEPHPPGMPGENSRNPQKRERFLCLWLLLIWGCLH